MITLEITSASKVGCVRSQNEDMILVDSHFIRNNEYSGSASLNHEDRFIIAVADGMGAIIEAMWQVATRCAIYSSIFMISQRSCMLAILTRRW